MSEPQKSPTAAFWITVALVVVVPALAFRADLLQ